MDSNLGYLPCFYHSLSKLHNNFKLFKLPHFPCLLQCSLFVIFFESIFAGKWYKFNMNWSSSLSYGIRNTLKLPSFTLRKTSWAYDVSRLTFSPSFLSKFLMYGPNIFELKINFLKFIPVFFGTMTKHLTLFRIFWSIWKIISIKFILRLVLQHVRRWKSMVGSRLYILLTKPKKLLQI